MKHLEEENQRLWKKMVDLKGKFKELSIAKDSDLLSSESFESDIEIEFSNKKAECSMTLVEVISSKKKRK